MRILVAEDNPINARLLKVYLRDSGAAIDITVNGEEACETHEFDIIIIDCKMPRVDGFEATRRIRQLPQPEKRDIPILGVTANVLESDVKRCFDAGMRRAAQAL